MIFIIIIFVLLILYKHYILYPFKIGKNHLSVFFGIPGAGKTTILASLARKYQKHGIPCYCNMPVKGCYKFDCIEDLGVYEISRCAVFVDEASIEFNSRSYKTFPKHLIAWFKMHRHEHCEVFIFSQSYEDFDITIKRLAYKFYLCRPSLLPFCFEAVPIVRKFGINDTTKKPDDMYSLHSVFTNWLYKRTFFAPLVWGWFDSWNSLRLPKKEFFKYPDSEFIKPKKYKKSLKHKFIEFIKARKYYKIVTNKFKRKKV